MTEEEFFDAVCRGMGWAPSPWRREAFKEWARREGMPLSRTWNPLATIRLTEETELNLDFNIGYGSGNWNAVPVRVYASPEAGVIATVGTLSLGYYRNIRRCFQDEKGYDEAIPEFITYVGSDAYGRELVNYWKTIKAGVPGASVNEVNEAVMKRLNIMHVATGDYQTMLGAWDVLKAGGFLG